MGLNATGRCPVAYAIVVTESGKHIAVELHGVRFDRVHFLEPNGEAEFRRMAVDRICASATERSMNDSKPGWLPNKLEKAQ